ncbi:MAG: hypothetical protein ACF8XB_05185 [Planctomycetota bacterium JB042]
MSAPHDDKFCRHCGDRLPTFGGGLGYCPPCARRYHRVVDTGPRASASTASAAFAEPSLSSEFVKDPLLATVLSTVLPGGGQFYNGHFLKGLLVLVTSPFVIPWLIGIVDAFFSARRHNRRRDEELIGMARPA